MSRLRCTSLVLLVALLPGCAQNMATAIPTSPPVVTAGAPAASPSAAPSRPTLAAAATVARTPGTVPGMPAATRTVVRLPGQITDAGTLSVPRAVHTATLLANGKVLIAGGCTRPSCETADDGATAELYDPATGSFAPTGRMTVVRLGHQAVPLRDGRVLIVGGWGRAGTLASAEIYDPTTGTFSATGAMRDQRGGHSATALPDGRVLVAGGSDGRRELASAEIYDPQAGSFAATGDLLAARAGHIAVGLGDGGVLILGGSGGRGIVLASAEQFDPGAATFRSAGNMTIPRHKHTAVALRDGRVLVVGGSDARDFRGRYTSVEVYDPTTGRFMALASMALARFKLGDSVVALPSGAVLVAGGGERAEILDPGATSFRTLPGSLGGAWSFSTATALRDGRVLIVGGYDDRIDLTANAWLYAE